MLPMVQPTVPSRPASAMLSGSDFPWLNDAIARNADGVPIMRLPNTPLPDTQPPPLYPHSIGGTDVESYLARAALPAPHSMGAHAGSAPGPLTISPLHATIALRQQRSEEQRQRLTIEMDAESEALVRVRHEPFPVVGDWAWRDEPNTVRAEGQNAEAALADRAPVAAATAPDTRAPVVAKGNQGNAVTSVLPLQSSILPNTPPASAPTPSTAAEPTAVQAAGTTVAPATTSQPGNTAAAIANAAAPPTDPYNGRAPTELKVYVLVAVSVLVVAFFLAWMFSWRRVNCCRRRYGAAFLDPVGQASAVRAILDSYVPV